MDSTHRPNDLLLLAGKAIAVLMQIAMAFGALVLIAVSVGLLFFSSEIGAEAAAEFGADSAAVPAMALVGAMLIGLAVVTALFFFFDKLRRIIDTVGQGDPFAPINAVRLNVMAWILLGIQLLMIPAAGFGLMLAKWADEVENANVTVDAGLDFEGVLMVIVLFILARVFKHGAAMRDDLEGTV